MSDTSDDSVDSVIAVHDPRRLKLSFPSSATNPACASQANLPPTSSSSSPSLKASATQYTEQSAIPKPEQQQETKLKKKSESKKSTTAGDISLVQVEKTPDNSKKLSNTGSTEVQEKKRQPEGSNSSLQDTNRGTAQSGHDNKNVNADKPKKESQSQRRRRNRKKSKGSPVTSPDSPKSITDAPEQTKEDKKEQTKETGQNKKQTTAKGTKCEKGEKQQEFTGETKTSESPVKDELQNVADNLARNSAQRDEAASSEMGNKFSSDKNKGGKDHDGRKKEKESKKKSKGKKSLSPSSDRDSSLGNRSSIETSDSYSSAATLVATANAAVGRRSPKKSPRAIPRSGVKLRDAVSSDDESFASVGFKTPQATTPVMKRSADPSSPSQRLLEFGRNIERDITEKFINKSPISGHFKKDSGEKGKKGNKPKVENPQKESKEAGGACAFPDKLYASLPKRCSKDVTVETDSDSFGIFENTDRLYASLPKDYYPIDDNLSDDVFMSCIDLASNNPDIPSRSHNSHAARDGNNLHPSPATARRDLKPTQSNSPKPASKQIHTAGSQSVSPGKTSSGPPKQSPASSRRANIEVSKSPLALKRVTDSPSSSRKPKPGGNSSPAISRKNTSDNPKSQGSGTQNREAAKTAPKSPTPAKHSPASPLASSTVIGGSKSPGRSRRRQTPSDGSKSPGSVKSDKIVSQAPRKELVFESTKIPEIPPHNTKPSSDSKAKERLSSQNSKSPKSSVDALATKVVEASKLPGPDETTKVQSSPQTPRQERAADSGRKKEHLKSTYDNVPDSDDSMVYFTGKNDPNFFEDNCVSEEIIATEKTPLHYKVEEPKKFGIEILKPPEQARIECVLLERKKRESDQKIEAELAKMAMADIGVAPIKKEDSDLTSCQPVDNPVKKSNPVASESPVMPKKTTGVSASKPEVQPSSPGTKTDTSTEQLTKRQIRRRNKKKNLKMGSKGSLDSGSDPPLSPEQIPAQVNISSPLTDATKITQKVDEDPKDTGNKEVNKTDDSTLNLSEISPIPAPNENLDAQPPTLPTDKVDNSESEKEPHKLSEVSDGKPPTVPSDKLFPISDIGSEKPGDAECEHVPPPSPLTSDALGGIVEEDEDEEAAESSTVDGKSKEVIIFGETILKRLSSLVESQGDGSELDKRFQHDFDKEEDDDDEGERSVTCQKTGLDILDEICDIGEKFKQEVVTNQEFEVKVTAHEHVPMAAENAAKVSDTIVLTPETHSPVQKRPSIPCELQLKNNTVVSDNSTVKSETNPPLVELSVPESSTSLTDSQHLAEVVDFYGGSPATGATSTSEIPVKVNLVSNLSPSLLHPTLSSDEDFHSPLQNFSDNELKIPAIEETFGELMSVKSILEDMEDKTPTAEALPKFISLEGMSSPPNYLSSGRRSRMSPAITERTESELDMSEQLDNVSISTDSMYADDEDDGSEMIFTKTYTEDRGECLVSCTFYNTAHDYDSDEFWAESSALDENYKVLEASADEASCTFKKARSEMHDIQRHLQDLRRQMEHLQEDVQSTSVNPTRSMASSEWRPITE